MNKPFGNNMAPFAEEGRGLRITLFASLSVLFLVGLSGNAIVCNTFRKHPSLRTVTNLIIINMAATAIVQCLLNIPASLANLALGRWALGDAFCRLNGFSSSVCLFESMFSLVVLCGSRYWCILHPTTFHRVFSKRRALAMIALSWSLAFALASPPLFGWSDFQPGGGKMACVSLWKHSVSYTIFVATTVFLLPSIAIMAAYYKIYRHIKVHQTGLLKRYAFSSLPSARPLGRTLSARRTSVFKDYQVTKLIWTLFVIFIASWVPYFGVNLVFEAVEDTIPASLDAILTWTTIFNTACSPIIYGLVNRQFRKRFWDGIGCFKNEDMRESVQRRWTAIRFRNYNDVHSSLRTCPQSSRAQFLDANTHTNGVVMHVSSV